MLDQEDWNINQRVLKFGDRLLLFYDIDVGGEFRFWIIIEVDCSLIMFLFFSDY